MCGICGVIPGTKTLEHTLTSIFRNLLIINSLRGVDGTGVFWKDVKEEAVTYNKKGISSHIYVDLPETKDVFQKIKGREFMVGHNRASTVGANSDDNSHPFAYGDVIGVHNGTLRGTWQLSTKNFIVDSMAIFHSLNEHADVQKTMNNLRGAAALVWYDHRTKLLHFWRNNERPLFFITDDDNNIWFASEPWMVTGLLGRAGIKTKKVEVLEAEHLVSYNYGEGKFHKKKMEQGKTLMYSGYDYYGEGVNWRPPFRSEVQQTTNVVPITVKNPQKAPSRSGLIRLDIPQEDEEFVIPETDYTVYDYDVCKDLPDRIWQNELKVGEHIFFCITTHSPDINNNSSVVDITGELHDVNDVQIKGFMSKVLLNFTYANKCMLYGKILSIENDKSGRTIQVSHVRSTVIADPLYMFAAGIKKEA